MNRLQLYAWLVAFCVISGCSTSAPIAEVVVEPIVAEPAPIVATPSWSVFENRVQAGSDPSLVLAFPGSDREIVLGSGGKNTFYSISDDGKKVAVAVSHTKSSNLYVYNASDGSFSTLHTGESNLVYTGDWDSTSSRFYFGVYLPEGKRMGAGSIHGYSSTTLITQKLPCSASRAVLAVQPGGSLLVRNSDSIFEVAAQDCATLKTIDARKMYHVSVSPKGGDLAFILRDLVYNREKRAYEPDSALYRQAIAGGDPIKIVGDKYQPRNISWSPDGTELVFDVDAQDGTGKRAISIYSLTSAGSTYLEAPISFNDSRSQPKFSPGGKHVAFSARGSAGTSNGQQDFYWKSEGDSFSHSVPTEKPEKIAWIGENQLFVWSGSQNTAHILDVSNRAGTVLWSGTAEVVFALPVK